MEVASATLFPLANPSHSSPAGDNPESTAMKVLDILPTAESTSATLLTIRSSLRKGAFSASKVLNPSPNYVLNTKQMGSSSELSSSMSLRESYLSAGSTSPISIRSSSNSRTLSLESPPQTLYKRIPNPSASPQLELETVTIRISNLKNKINPNNYCGPTFSEVLRVPSYTLVEQLGNHLLTKQPGKSTQQTIVNN